MDVTRLLRVLMTILLVATFILVTVATYKENLKVEAMVKLSDSASSIATRLTVQDLAWTDAREPHPYVLDPDRLNDLNYRYAVGGDNFGFQVRISYWDGGSDENLGPYGPKVPEDKMTDTLTLPVTLRKNCRMFPARLTVVVWHE
ncbi:MAG: hypothetical protein J7J17_03530 [Hadesarchaea archaeon]|nr:hypothetical protein [Hadesarchaea archaeon]